MGLALFEARHRECVKTHRTSLHIGDRRWVNDSVLTKTGDRPEDYTTSVLGNASVEWIRSVLSSGKTHPPFFAWIGPHAPHLPSTPAPWYLDHPIGLLKAPRTVHYNYSAVDHHPLVANQPILNDADAKSIDQEYSMRMRSLLSVDDIVVALHGLLQAYDEWDNTYFLFSSGKGLPDVMLHCPMGVSYRTHSHTTLYPNDPAYYCVSCRSWLLSGPVPAAIPQDAGEGPLFSPRANVIP